MVVTYSLYVCYLHSPDLDVTEVLNLSQTLVMKQQLTGTKFSDSVRLRADHRLEASVVFSSMVGELSFSSTSVQKCPDNKPVFDLLRDQLHTIFGMLPDLIQGTRSLSPA